MTTHNRSERRGALTIILLCVIAYISIYIARKNFSVCMTDMIAEGLIDKVTGGTAGTAFLACYAGGQLFNGILGDKISPKYMVTIGLIGAGICNLLMGSIQIALLVPILWGFNGYFCSMLWSPIIRGFSEWLPDGYYDLSQLIMGAAIPLGSIGAYSLSALMISVLNWRAAFIASGCIAIAMGIIFFLWLSSLSGFIARYSISHTAKPKEKNEESTPAAGKNVGAFTLILSSGLSFAVLGIFANGILKDGLDLWIPSLFSEYFVLDSSTVALLTTILPIINFSGAATAQWINAKLLHNELSTSALLFAVSTALFIPLLLIINAGQISFVSAIICMVLLALVSAAMLGANTMILAFIPYHFRSIGRASSVTGFLNCCSYAAAALSGVTIGVISSSCGWLITILAFALCALLGAIACAVGIPFWIKGRNRIAAESAKAKEE